MLHKNIWNNILHSIIIDRLNSFHGVFEWNIWVCLMTILCWRYNDLCWRQFSGVHPIYLHISNVLKNYLHIVENWRKLLWNMLWNTLFYDGPPICERCVCYRIHNCRKIFYSNYFKEWIVVAVYMSKVLFKTLSSKIKGIIERMPQTKWINKHIGM